ncbi:MAG: hypothetical protein ACD_37C00492G0001 [uncultured bacterium]|nr:MAG: hypothetical protein ACD_37C00492G0001 [uncultured bacterium]
MIGYKFGTVCTYGGREWIFLAETEDIVYLGKVLDPQETKQVERVAENNVRKNTPNVERIPLFSYVILKTKELEQRAAHFGQPDHNSEITNLFQLLNITLTKEDLKSIKDEITKDGCVNIGLRDQIKDIEI